MGGGDKVQSHKDIKVRIPALFGGFLCKPGLSSPATLSMTTVSPNISIMSIMLFEPQGLFMPPLLGSMDPPAALPPHVSITAPAVVKIS